MSTEDILEKQTSNPLLDRREEPNYFYADQEVDFDVADFISKSVPKQAKQNPALDSYITFAKTYGCVLVGYSAIHFIFILYNLDDFTEGGKYYGGFHYYFIFANTMVYLFIGLSCLYAAYFGSAERVANGYVKMMAALLIVFIADSFDIAYLGIVHNVYNQWWEWLFCLILYLCGYVNHYDFRKKLKKSKIKTMILGSHKKMLPSM